MLGLARQPYYRWLDSPVTDAESAEAYRANALFDAHRDDPEFGHRFLLYEARAAGESMAERTAWRICRDNGWWSAFGKRRGRGKNSKAGPLGQLNRVKLGRAGPGFGGAVGGQGNDDMVVFATGLAALYVPPERAPLEAFGIGVFDADAPGGPAALVLAPAVPFVRAGGRRTWVSVPCAGSRQLARVFAA
ncbi:hypothetical protein ACQEV4_20770 [Streptomyces shenzhenensis]